MKTKITEMFGVEAPIVLAPMGGVAGGALAAAVTDAGGLGLIGCGYADPKTGYGSNEWIHQQFDLVANRRVGRDSLLGAWPSAPRRLMSYWKEMPTLSSFHSVTRVRSFPEFERPIGW
jgi:hypothetical protein